MDPKDDTDLQMAALADRQYGVVTRQQLLELGFSATAIRERLARRRLRRLHRGVFAVGHAELRREGHWIAAVLACGKGAALSHWDAAALWNLLPPRERLIHVTRPSTSGRAPDPARIRLHRVGTIRAWERTLNDGIPITSVARTLLDLSALLRPRAIEDVIAQAVRLQRFDLGAVRRCLDEHPRQPGAPALRRVLADLDFSWPHRRLVVEADSYTYDSMPSAFERDRERDQVLTLAGFTVVRVTFKQVTRQRSTVAARLTRLLR